MPSSSLSYSPLEGLLLFLYLRNYGVSWTVFDKISHEIKDNPQIKDGLRNDGAAARLDPDALREYFLKLCKEELRSEGGRSCASEADALHGSSPGSGSPRKRKVPSPTVPTIQDAANDAQLLPKILLRLYDRYREQAVREVREDENRAVKLQQEIKDYQASVWDDDSRSSLEDTSHKQPHATETILDKPPDTAPRPVLKLEPCPSPRANRPVKVTPSTRSPRPSDAAAGPAVIRAPADRKEPANRRLSPSSTTIALPKTVPRKSQSASIIQAPDGPPDTSATVPSPLVPRLHSPRTAIKGAQSSHQPNSVSPTATQAAVQLQPQPPDGSHGSPRSQLPTCSRAQSKPIVANHVQQSSPPIIADVSSDPDTSAYALPEITSTSRLVPPHSSHKSGSISEPLQLDRQALAQPVNTAPLSSIPPTAPPPTPIEAAVLSQASPSDTPQILPDLLDSVSQLLRTYQTPTKSDAPSTAWKPATLTGPPLEPSRGSISPITRPSASPTADSAQKFDTEIQTQAGKAHSTLNSSADAAPVASTLTSKVTAEVARGTSPTSSVIDSSARRYTRSQSIVSQTCDDAPKFKPSTPTNTMDSCTKGDATMPAPSVLTRRLTGGKRRRSPTSTLEITDTNGPADSVDSQASPKHKSSSDVLAVRNFSRMSNTVMNDITSHKHASIFSRPISDNIAPGYSTIVHHPTDLKTIRTAIIAGGRAVNAASIDSSASSAYLPWSEDLVPPKGIVNSGQLEREIMRMFANAVMFNSGESDHVQVAREMFEATEAALVNFRSAEKTAEASAAARRRGESEVVASEEDSAFGLSATSSTTKRRKG